MALHSAFHTQLPTSYKSFVSLTCFCDPYHCHYPRIFEKVVTAVITNKPANISVWNHRITLVALLMAIPGQRAAQLWVIHRTHLLLSWDLGTNCFFSAELTERHRRGKADWSSSPTQYNPSYHVPAKNWELATCGCKYPWMATSWVQLYYWEGKSMLMDSWRPPTHSVMGRISRCRLYGSESHLKIHFHPGDCLTNYCPLRLPL